MAKLIIRGAFPDELNGEYEIELANGFTKSEHFLMKKEVNVVVGDYLPGAAVDANVMTAWGLVALRRAGKELLFPAFMETTDTQTEWEFKPEEVGDEDAVPPAIEPAASDEPESKNDSSGDGTSNGSAAFPVTTPLPTGLPR